MDLLLLILSGIELSGKLIHADTTLPRDISSIRYKRARVKRENSRSAGAQLRAELLDQLVVHLRDERMVGSMSEGVLLCAKRMTILSAAFAGPARPRSGRRRQGTEG